MSRLTVGIMSAALCGITFAVAAGSVTEIRPGTLATRTIEVTAGMLVTGSIVVAADGSVRSYSLDQVEKIPGVVVSLIGKSAPAWRFQPTMLNGQPVATKATMNLRIIAKEQKDGGYSFSITGATFPQLTESQAVNFAQQRQPVYPASAVRDHVSGTVYLRLRINQLGSVVGAFAEQVDLDINPNAVPAEFQLKKWRLTLTEAALAAAQTWKLGAIKPNEDTEGDWYVVTPINFHLFESGNGRVDRYGKWDIYLPGPIQQSPWSDEGKAAPANLDAIPAGSIALGSTGLHLTTPLGGS